MTITDTLEVASRTEWRAWLSANHATAREIWLLFPRGRSGPRPLTYLDAVEEALCWGWIDGIAKGYDGTRTAQRFSPRRKGSHWTELNKERARRLIATGQMTDAGRASLPDLSPGSFEYPPDIIAELAADPETWTNYQAFPELYRRIRVGYIEEVRRQPDVFRARLDNFKAKTKQNKRFGGEP